MVTPTVFETITDQQEASSLDDLYVAAESSVISETTKKVSISSVLAKSADIFNYNGLIYKGVGNISDFAGQQLQAADKANAYQYPDDSRQFYAADKSQSFPVTIPADPSSDNGWGLVNALSQDSLSNYTDIVYDNVNDMISGFPVIAKVGDTCLTSGTRWSPTVSPQTSISDFELKSESYASGFGSSQADLESAYAAGGIVVVDKDYSVNNFDIAGPTDFINGAKLICTGTLSISGEILAGNVEIADITAVTSFVVDGSIIHEIKNKWFSATKYGQSQTVYGNKAGAKLLGNKVVHGTDYNALFGFRCGEELEDAIESAFFGTFAGAGCTFAHLSTGLGYGALRGKESSPGSGTFEVTEATNTTAIGQGTLQDGTSHSNSTVVGSGAGRNIPVSVSATIIGANAGRLSGDLRNVIFIGAGTGYNWGSTGSDLDSQYTTLIGSDIAFNCTQGLRSTLIGARAGLYSKACNNNTWIGYLTGPDSAASENVSDSICIGDASRTRENDTITIGNELTNSVAGRTLIGNTASQTRCDIAGIYTNTNAAAANVYIGSDSQLYRSTSSLKYKEVIEPMKLEWAYKTLDFEPILYKPTENAERDDWSYYGYGAEQVAKIDPRFVQMAKEVIGVNKETGEPLLSENHSPNGVMYDRIVVAQGMIISDLLKRVEALEGK